jgi:SPP1 family predicted phage head-tail adaptor
MALLEAGRLDRRVRIERAAVTTSDTGNNIETWAPLVTVWAQRMPQRAIEAWRAGGTAAEMETAWRIRWSSQVADLSPRDRLRFPAADDGAVYEIIGVTEIGRREGLEIVTKAVAA